MVESIKGVGQIQGTQNQSTNKTQGSSRSESTSKTSATGEVELEISSEALSLSQAEGLAKNVRGQLESTDQSLSKAADLERFLA